MNAKHFTIVALSTMLLLALAGCERIHSDAIALDPVWKFKYDPDRIGLRQGWSDKDHDRSSWDTLAVPGVWPDETYDGFAWYATELQLKHMAAGYKLALQFESVDDNAVVWLDGRLFGTHMGYGQKFYMDLDDRLSDGKPHQLVVRIEDTGGPGGINGAVMIKPYINEEDLLRTEASKQAAPAAPSWAEDAVVYEVFVRQHTEAGTFKALAEDLDRIKDLGVDLIWLMPVHPIGKERSKGSFGSPYSVKDYYAVSADLGTLKDFKSLVEQVHARDMHIILDFVLNHTSWDNDLMDDHPEWYTHNQAGDIISPNEDWYDVADLNYDDRELRNYMIDMLTWWIKETDIDGFRFDVAELVPNDFWAAAKAACRKVKPGTFFLAEGARPELHLSGHDMTYSWNMWAGLVQLAQGTADPSEVKRSYEMERLQYPQGALRMRFTENHDKVRSAKNIPDPDLNLTAWACAALMKGNPLIYAGQEVGASVTPDLFEKDPIDWSAGQTNLEPQFRDIIALRKENIKPDSPFQFILADNEKRILAHKHGPLLSFFNFSAEPFRFSAEGMDSIVFGDISLEADSSLVIPPGKFGVIK